MVQSGTNALARSRSSRRSRRKKKKTKKSESNKQSGVHEKSGEKTGHGRRKTQADTEQGQPALEPSKVMNHQTNLLSHWPDVVVERRWKPGSTLAASPRDLGSTQPMNGPEPSGMLKLATDTPAAITTQAGASRGTCYTHACAAVSSDAACIPISGPFRKCSTGEVLTKVRSPGASV